MAAPATGLAPLARGRLGDRVGGFGADGTIPARAGTTREAELLGELWEDYPRSRGDDTNIGLGSGSAVGLSPLARGRRPGRRGHRPGLGTIPARAGTTSSTTGVRAEFRDYPRSRGDDMLRLAIFLLALGLSPLARGRRRVGSDDDAVVGTIPARAGTTRSGGGSRRRTQDYPRSRGDDHVHVPLCDVSRGLSPLARGRPMRPTVTRARPRTIPARAGTTNNGMSRSRSRADYPRSRGDDTGSPVTSSG